MIAVSTAEAARRTRHLAGGGLHRLHDDRGVLYGNCSFWRHWLDSAGVINVHSKRRTDYALGKST